MKLANIDNAQEVTGCLITLLPDEYGESTVLAVYPVGTSLPQNLNDVKNLPMPKVASRRKDKIKSLTAHSLFAMIPSTKKYGFPAYISNPVKELRKHGLTPAKPLKVRFIDTQDDSGDQIWVWMEG